MTDQVWSEAQEALNAGKWDEARPLLESVLERSRSNTSRHAQALTGLSDVLWWQGEVEKAIEMRIDAYQTWRTTENDIGAASAALWLAREFGAAGNHPVSSGWLARAETIAVDEPALAGWVALTRAALAYEPTAQEEGARLALAVSRESGDGDLEALALGRLGLALVTLGQLDEGLVCFDEAMAAATGGDSTRPTLALLCCDLALATELSGEVERFARWNDVVFGTTVRTKHPDLVSFCSTCCAEVFSAMGDWTGAETQLRRAVDMLAQGGHSARCVAPTARLAELLVLQGRIEEAEAILAGDTADASLMVRARIALLKGDTDLAVTLAERHRRRYGGDTLLTAPALGLQVEALVEANDVEAAEEVVGRLLRLAAETGNRRTASRAELARARVLTARGMTSDSIGAFEAALDLLTAVAPMAIETSDAHFGLATLLAAESPALAREEAKVALKGYETAGATHHADAAAALLRSLGDRSRVGAKGTDVLTDREKEVLRLVAQGLTNAEIADRLYISTKTAGNHVSNILTKLGMRSRVEAAAFAALHPGY